MFLISINDGMITRELTVPETVTICLWILALNGRAGRAWCNIGQFYTCTDNILFYYIMSFLLVIIIYICYTFDIRQSSLSSLSLCPSTGQGQS